jgi:hypothetical protein
LIHSFIHSAVEPLIAGLSFVLAGVRHRIVTAEFNPEAARVAENNMALVNDMLQGSHGSDDATARRLVFSGYHSGTTTALNVKAADQNKATDMSSPHFASQAVQAVDAIRTDACNGHSVGVIVYGSSASVSEIETKKMLLQLLDAFAKRDDQEIIMASVSTCAGAGSRGGNRAALNLLDDLKLLSITGAEHLGDYFVKYKSSRVTADKLSVFLLGAHLLKEFRNRPVPDRTEAACTEPYPQLICEIIKLCVFLPAPTGGVC